MKSRAICAAKSLSKFAAKNLAAEAGLSIAAFWYGPSSAQRASRCAIVAGRFLLYSPQVLLLKPDQIELTGNHIVSREAVLQPFARDRNRSVLRIPLDARRAELEALPWVESASVQRILPNRIRVELTNALPSRFCAMALSWP